MLGVLDIILLYYIPTITRTETGRHERNNLKMFPCNLPGFEDFLDMVELGFYLDVKHGDKSPKSILKSSHNKNEIKIFCNIMDNIYIHFEQNLLCIIYERHWHYV